MPTAIAPAGLSLAINSMLGNMPTVQFSNALSGGIFVALLISMVIGASLISTIANSSKAATSNANVTGGAKDLTTLLPLVFVAAVIIRSVKEGVGE